jgi:toxin FitB
MSAMRSVPSVDTLLAATAKVHRMTLATRNLSDVADLGADVLNPFEQTAEGR